MKLFRNQKLALLSACTFLTLNSCGQREVNSGYTTLSDVPSTNAALETPVEGSPEETLLNPGLEEIGGACQYWRGLPSLSKEASPFQAFELFEELSNDADANAVGVYNLAALPPARYGMSKEYNGGKELIPAGTFDEFYEMASAKIAAGIAKLQQDKAGALALIDSKIAELQKALDENKAKQPRTKELEDEKKQLETEIKDNQNKRKSTAKAYDEEIKKLNKKQKDLNIAKENPWYARPLNPRGKALTARNEQTVAAVEAVMPGVFTGKAGVLTQTKFYQGLLLAMGESRLSSAEINELKPLLTKRVPLFIKDSWKDRRHDLARMLRVLEAEYDVRTQSQEKACQYLVSLRLLSQLLTIKGFEGAPQLLTNGRLVAMPTEWGPGYSYHNIKSGAFSDVIVNKTWVGQQLARATAVMKDENGNELRNELGETIPDLEQIRSIPRMKNSETSEGYVESLRFWALLTSARKAQMWQRDGQALSAGDVKIPINLLQLSFGMLSFHLSVFKNIELTVLPASERGPTNGYLRVREDEPNTLASIIVFAFNFVEGMETMNGADDLSRVVLDEASHAKFVTKTTGVIDGLKSLRTAGLAEGAIRMRGGKGSASLKLALERYLGRR